MTSIAVTASKCVNASEVALLVACFMPFLPRLGLFRPGTTHRHARTRNNQSNCNSEHPTLRIRLMSSPSGEYRLCQGRTVIRRQFDSRVVLLRRAGDTPQPNQGFGT